MRALRDLNTPKIVQQDKVVFFGATRAMAFEPLPTNAGLLNDLFPGVDPPRVVDATLERCVIKATERLSLWPDEHFTLKVTQLNELLAIRHCVFVMGPAGSGKSTCWKTLSSAVGDMAHHQKVRVACLNPKVMPTEDLYGHITLQTREWKDGLLSHIMRNLGQINDDQPKWCEKKKCYILRNCLLGLCLMVGHIAHPNPPPS
jgi:dynein heavy chain